MLGLLVLISTAACGEDGCWELADRICDCEGINPRICEQARLTAAKADKDDTGLWHADCRAELKLFRCIDYTGGGS